jgi:hypothetical protein
LGFGCLVGMVWVDISATDEAFLDMTLFNVLHARHLVFSHFWAIYT